MTNEKRGKDNEARGMEQCGESRSKDMGMLSQQASGCTGARRKAEVRVHEILTSFATLNEMSRAMGAPNPDLECAMAFRFCRLSAVDRCSTHLISRRPFIEPACASRPEKKGKVVDQHGDATTPPSLLPSRRIGFIFFVFESSNYPQPESRTIMVNRRHIGHKK
jgi:hypothetical protein